MSFASSEKPIPQISGYFETYHLQNDYDEITKLILYKKFVLMILQ